jgi:hypothetical protein
LLRASRSDAKRMRLSVDLDAPDTAVARLAEAMV